MAAWTPGLRRPACARCHEVCACLVAFRSRLAFTADHTGARLSLRPMRPARRWLLLTVVLATGLALAASHPWSDYDDTRGTWLKGTIRSSTFERPHQTITLEQDGAPHRVWKVILASPSKMEGRGLRVASLVPGLRVRVYVYPAIDVPDEGRALRIDIGGQITELW